MRGMWPRHWHWHWQWVGDWTMGMPHWQLDKVRAPSATTAATTTETAALAA